MSQKNKKTSDLSEMDRDQIIALTRKMAKGDLRKQILSSNNKPLFEPAKTDFSTLKLYQELETQHAFAELAELANPYFHLHQKRAGATTWIEGQEYINYSAYDYLGLNAHEDVARAAKEAIDLYGTSVSASRPTSGDRPVHRKLEKQLAALYGTDDALVFVSGHATNVSTIGDLMGPGDLILYDGLSHNSITTGAKLSGATRRVYGHSDEGSLENILAQNRAKFNRILIVVEGLYSMDGDIADLPRLIEIKEKYGAWLMVDEAHSLGVLGKTGLGVFEHFSIEPSRVDIWMGTLSKTLSGCGGYIAGDRALIEVLKYYASGFMYSVGMSPPVAAASSRSLELMSEEPERVSRLHGNGKFFLDAAKNAGLDTGLSEGFSIIPVIVGDSLRTVKLSNLLMGHGIFTIPVLSPAVPEKAARIRFFITSEHTTEQMSTTVNLVAQELKRLDDENFGVHTIIGSRNGEQS